MDTLDRLAEPAADLLARVDAALATGGAHPAHPIWPLIRRLGVLPGGALAAIVALRPEDLAAAAPTLHAFAGRYAALAATHVPPTTWQGRAGTAYARHRDDLIAYLDGRPDSAAGRLADTARYAEALAGWMADSRAALAGTLAAALGSAEAVTLVTTPDTDPGWSARARAAADLGARVLTPAAEAYEAGADLRDRWGVRLAELLGPPGPAGW